MDRLEAKELVKKYPICLIYKENGEDVRFNLFEYAIEIERMEKEIRQQSNRVLIAYIKLFPTDRV